MTAYAQLLALVFVLVAGVAQGPIKVHAVSDYELGGSRSAGSNIARAGSNNPGRYPELAGVRSNNPGHYPVIARAGSNYIVRVGL